MIPFALRIMLISTILSISPHTIKPFTFHKNIIIRHAARSITTIPRTPRRSTCRRPPFSIAATRSSSPPSPNNSDNTIINRTTPYTITTPPTDVNVLQKVVQKHYDTLDLYLTKKPIAKHTIKAFDIANRFIEDFYNARPYIKMKGVILDSGCGTARSTLALGQLNPDRVVIGIDRSLSRLQKNASSRHRHLSSSSSSTTTTTTTSSNTTHQTFSKRPNVLLLRAELSDFWRCCYSYNTLKKQWHIDEHYLLYPNPYPKQSQLKRRWYGHPSFPLLLSLNAEKIIVRSNWNSYLIDFGRAVESVSVGSITSGYEVTRGPEPLVWGEEEERGVEEVVTTNFELKYRECREAVFQMELSRQGREG